MEGSYKVIHHNELNTKGSEVRNAEYIEMQSDAENNSNNVMNNGSSSNGGNVVASNMEDTEPSWAGIWDTEYQSPQQSYSDTTTATEQKPPEQTDQIATPSTTTCQQQQPQNQHKYDEEFSAGCCGALIVDGLERYFAGHGRLVALYPVQTIAICVVCSLVAGLGLVNFSAELMPLKLWLPHNSSFTQMQDWQKEHFPNNFRRHVVLWEAANVLTAESIQEMWRLHQAVRDAVDPATGKSWQYVCAQIPSLKVDFAEQVAEEDSSALETLELRKKLDKFDETDDFSLKLSRDSYCRIVMDLPSYCFETGLLEIWGWKNDLIMNLTDTQVINDFNKASNSDVYGFTTNFDSYLGKTSRNNKGEIVSAKAAKQTWFTEINKEFVKAGDYEIDLSSGELVDTVSMSWEALWIETVQNATFRNKNMMAFANAASSVGRISDDNSWVDVEYLTIGLALMTIFVSGTLGRRNLVEQRPLLALCGLLSVALSILASYGICSVCSVKFGQMNSLLALLLFGLGVNDLFIIVAVWNNDSRKHEHSSCSTTKSVGRTDNDLIEKAARTMRNAGLAITATSITGVTAFAVGATTSLPALRSLCIYASIGILITFILQSTFFLAFLVIDERRLRSNRNGFMWFIIHKKLEPKSCSKVDIFRKFFKFYGTILIKNAARCVVIFLTISLVTVSVLGTNQFRQEFNPDWFIPSDSYLADYFAANKINFEREGSPGYIYFTNQSITHNLPTFSNFAKELAAAESVVEVEDWIYAFTSYEATFSNKTLTGGKFSDVISLFFATTSGGRFRSNVIFDGKISCNDTAPHIKYFRIPLKFKSLETVTLQSNANVELNYLFEKWDLPGYEGTWAPVYMIWEANSVVGSAYYHNIKYMALAVAGMTLVLLASFKAALLVIGCVTGTVVTAMATLCVFGFTLDPVSCTALVLSIGLSIDYSVHIVHGFLSDDTTADKKERVVNTLTNVGPAILQGGISMLIPFAILAFSNSHVFRTFFAVFTPTTIVGLYYAFAFLPVLLSIAGPDPRRVCSTETTITSSGRKNGSFKKCSEYDFEPYEGSDVFFY